MTEEELEKLRYPIGHFVPPARIDSTRIASWIADLEALPSRLTDLVNNLNDEQLNTPYRPGGWTIRQTVHHLSDSHHNSYIRFKWALTETNPTIKAYDEKLWAELSDSKNGPIGMSLDHLSAVHVKLVYLLKGLSGDALNKTFKHPETGAVTTLRENIGRYAWHGNHHLAQLAHIIQEKGWNLSF